MSLGLGKLERFVMDALTYPGKNELHDTYYLWKYSFGELVWLFFETGHGNTNPEELGICTNIYYSNLDKHGKSIYQSLARAVRNLKRLGFIKTSEVPYDEMLIADIPKLENRMKKLLSFESKSIVNGIPWQLKYLTKRIVEGKKLNLYLNGKGK